MDAALRALLSSAAEARVQVMVVVELSLNDQCQTATVVPVPFASVPLYGGLSFLACTVAALNRLLRTYEKDISRP